MKKITFLTIFQYFIVMNSQTHPWEWAVEGKGVQAPRLEFLNGYLYLTGTFNHSCSVNGEIMTSSDPQSAFVVKLSAGNAVQWSTVVSASKISVADIHKTASGIYIAGSFNGSLSGYAVSAASAGGSDIFWMRLSQGGNVEYYKTDGSAKDEFLTSFDVDSQIVVAGQFEAGASLSGHTLTGQASSTLNVFFSKYDRSNGNQLWLQEISGTTGAENAINIKAMFDRQGNVVLQNLAGGAMNYAGTYTGFCELCRPMVRFKGIDGTLMDQVGDTHDGSGQEAWVNADVGIDADNNAYALGERVHNFYMGYLDKFSITGSNLYSRDIGSQFRPDALYIRGTNLYTIGKKYDNSILVQQLDKEAVIIGQGTAAVSGTTQGTGVAPYMEDIAADDSNNIYITGTTDMKIDFGNHVVNSANGSSVLFIAKLDATKTLSVSEKLAEQSYFYPNPSAGPVEINTGKAHHTTIAIYNLFGDCVYREENAGGRFTLYPPSLVSGIYTISIDSDENHTRSIMLRR